MRSLLNILEQPRWQVGLLTAFVFVSLAFLLPSVAKYHGDECFYTDAAIRMTQTGDYLTPYAANGALRFAKPILPYWAVAAGYLPLGINFFASRVLFLVAGCLVILLTYRLSLDLFNRPGEAVLSALIMASNVQLLTISIRSTPDALLCLFVLLSLMGSARLIFQEKPSWKSYALTYLGAALAVETRGLPGLGVALYPFVFCLLFRRGQTPLRRLLEWKAMMIGLAVALAWFGAMLWLHGNALIEGFYYDQVTENVREYHYLDSVRNLWAYAFGVVRHFLPWSALLMIGLIIDRQITSTFYKEHRGKIWFCVGWLLFILVPFVFGGSHRTRYMIVAYPPLAVVLAGLLRRHSQIERFQNGLVLALRGAAVVLGLFGVVLLGAGAILHPRAVAGGIVFLLAAIALWLLCRRGRMDLSWTAAAAVPIVAFLVVELFLRPIFAISPSRPLVARLLPDDSMKRRVYALNLSPSYQAQMRVFSAGRLTVVPVTADKTDDLPANADPWVFSTKDKALLAQQAGTLDQVGFAGGKWKVRDYLDLLQPARRTDALGRNLVPYYLLFPDEEAKRSSVP